MDVLYVVTGERVDVVVTPDALGPDEVELLRSYNGLTGKAKTTIRDLVGMLTGK